MDPDKTYQLGKVAVELHQTIKDVVDYLTSVGNAIPKKAPQALANHPISETMYIACVKKFNHDLYLRIEKEKDKAREDLKRREQEQKRREEMARIEQEIKRTTHLDAPIDEAEQFAFVPAQSMEPADEPEPVVVVIPEPVVEAVPEVAPEPVQVSEPEPQPQVVPQPEPEPVVVSMQPLPEPVVAPVEPVVVVEPVTVVSEPVVEQPPVVVVQPVVETTATPVTPSTPPPPPKQPQAAQATQAAHPAKPTIPEGAHIPLPKHSGLKIVSTGEPAPPRVRRKPETPPHALTKVPRGIANLPREAAPPRPSPVPTTSAKHSGAPGARPAAPAATTDAAKTETTGEGEKKWKRLSKLTKAEADELVRAKSKALKERVAPAALPEIARSRRPKSRKSVDTQAVESQLRQTLA
ncbi:MAG: hypothetical protein OEM52_14770, partial [bacterium]|nr:hypothetical protein [bacterium]